MTKEMFFYILLHGPLERDAIGVVFWPDLSARKVTNNFYYAVSQIRRAVGGDAVVAEGSVYRIGEDYWFDVEEFEAVIEQARLISPRDSLAEDLWRRAVTLYRGDFLPEVERVWCVPKREALRETYVEALVGVGQCHEARGELEGAISWYRRALEVDELREDVHRHVMRCYSEAGRRPDALAQYQRCREILKRELGLEPSGETEKLYKQIATGNQQEP
jgi:two-component SAPR family response regulator